MQNQKEIKRKTMMPVPKDREKIHASGFTLIEVMIVVAIFSIAILGAMSLQIGAIQGNSKARKSTLAMEYAADTMEHLMRIGGGSDDRYNFDDDGDGNIDNLAESELNNDGVDNNGDGTADETGELEWHRLPEFSVGTDYTRAASTNIPEDDYLSGIYDLTWDVTDVDSDGDGTDDAKRIDITVTWENGSREINLSGLRSSVF